MKSIKCDRCGKDIPYVPPYMNCTIQDVINPIIMISAFDPVSSLAREVDLCSECQKAVYDYIFDYGNGDGA